MSSRPTSMPSAAIRTVRTDPFCKRAPLAACWALGVADVEAVAPDPAAVVGEDVWDEVCCDAWGEDRGRFWGDAWEGVEGDPAGLKPRAARSLPA